jgi:EF hand
MQKICVANYKLIFLLFVAAMHHINLVCVFFSGAFRLYDVDNDGYITRDEMYNIVDAIYQMVVCVAVTAALQSAFCGVRARWPRALCMSHPL